MALLVPVSYLCPGKHNSANTHTRGSGFGRQTVLGLPYNSSVGLTLEFLTAVELQRPKHVPCESTGSLLKHGKRRKRG